MLVDDADEVAAILDGLRCRHVHGQTIGACFEGIGEAIHSLLAAGLDALKE